MGGNIWYVENWQDINNNSLNNGQWRSREKNICCLITFIIKMFHSLLLAIQTIGVNEKKMKDVTFSSSSRNWINEMETHLWAVPRASAMWNLPGGKQIKLKFGRMSLMKAVHISAQISFDVYSSYPKTNSLQHCPRVVLSPYMAKWDKLIVNQWERKNKEKRKHKDCYSQRIIFIIVYHFKTSLTLCR